MEEYRGMFMEGVWVCVQKASTLKAMCAKSD